MSIYKNEDVVSIEYTKPVYKIKWRLTGWCNFHCPYCSNAWNQSKFQTTEELIETAKRINELVKKAGITKPLHINLIGGEPSYFDYPKIIPYIENVSNLHLTTNFSRDNQWYQDFHMWCREHKIKLFINCSEHAEHKNFQDKFIEFTNWCRLNGFSLPRASIVITADKDIKAILKKYEDNGVTRIMLQKEQLPETKILNTVSDDVEKIMNDHIARFEKEAKARDFTITFKDGSQEKFQSINHFLDQLDCDGFVPKNCSCDAGVNGIIINWNGDLFRGSCAILNGKSFGNLFDPDVELPTEPFICDHPEVRCAVCNSPTIKKLD